MALEASIVERLQELRKWQIDQQERLMKQQQEQRELLSIEQERMYEALGLSMKDVDESIIDEMSVSKSKHIDAYNEKEKNDQNFYIESPDTPNISKQRIITSRDNSPDYNDSREQLNAQLSVPDVCLKNFETDLTISDSSNYQNLPLFKLQTEINHQAIDETPKRFRRNHLDTDVERSESPAHDKSTNKFLQIDELPLPSPKKDFTTLLEEKLRDDSAKSVDDRSQTKNPVKQPFLRKGEGLARFRFNSASINVKKPAKSRNASRFTNSSSITPQKSATKKVIEKPKANGNTKKINNISRRSVNHIPNVAQQKLILSNVSLPKKSIRNSRSLPASVPAPVSPVRHSELTDKCVSNDESNPSDLDTSKMETKMFEMLEEKAENSSFCSTSSAVIAFMQQSTPIKLKNIRRNLPSQKQIPGANLRTNDNVLNEIVNTLKSNKLPESSVMQIRKTYAQKDVVMSKWNSGPFTNEISSQTHVRNAQQPIRQIVQPIDNKKSQFDNNNRMGMNNSDDEDSASNMSGSTDRESLCENNFHTLNNPLNDNDEGKDKKIDSDVSMHVRFAEFNEYKTIGLTDTSTLSTDSHSVLKYDKDNNWDDSSENEGSSDSETSSPSPSEETNRQHLLSDSSKPKNTSMDQFSGMNGDRVMNREMRVAREFHDNAEISDTNLADQNTDDETSMFNDSDGTYYDEDNTIAEIQEAMAKILDKNEREIESKLTDELKSSVQSKLSTNTDTIFKSDLLKNRLLELEREIDIFRKENAALSSERKKLQDEHRKLQREFKEKAASLEHERNEMNIAFQEEKKRLTREKSALESRLRDAREKSIQSKQERQEIQMLSQQLDELREDMAEKESRWQAAQARQRSQTRVLHMENSKLKLEIERLQSTKRVGGKLKRPNIISNTKAIHQINKELDDKTSIPRKQVPESDEELEKVKVIHKRNSDVPVSSPPRNSTSSSNTKTEKTIVYNPVTTQKPIPNLPEKTISKKRHLYETLLQDATVGYDERDYAKSPIIIHNNNNDDADDDDDDDRVDMPPTNYNTRKDIELNLKPSVENEFTVQRSSDSAYQSQNQLLHDSSEREDHEITKLRGENKVQIAPAQLNEDTEPPKMIRGSYQQFVRDVINPRNEVNQLVKSNSNIINTSKTPEDKNSYQRMSYISDKIKSRTNQMQTVIPSPLINDSIDRLDDNVGPPTEERVVKYTNDRFKFICPTDSDLTPRKEHQDPMPRPTNDITPRPEHIQVSQICDLPPPSKFNSSLSSAHQNVREVKHPDGHMEYWYPNGNVKRIYPDRNITKMIYYNGDVRETLSDGCVKYFYAATKTWHTTYPDGFEILEFPDGQQERRTKDGVVEVCFPDGSVRLMQPDGIEKWALPDGTIAETFPNGEKILSLPNGQREIHTTEHKRREYPDGTVKFVYPDGTQETRYANGRIRIKDKDGNLVMDSHQI